jgi:hypothetical protein
MNKNLLKKIKAGIGQTAGNYCGCFNAYVSAAINEVYRNVPNPIDYEALPEGFCEKCRKPVDTEFIDNLNAKLAIILPMYRKPLSKSAVSIDTLTNAARTVQPVGSDSARITRSEAAERLQVPLSDIVRHIRSGRLKMDASGKFVDSDSFEELEKLIRSKS